MAITDNTAFLNTDPNSFIQYTNSLMGNQNNTPSFKVGVAPTTNTVASSISQVGNSQNSAVTPGTPQSGSTTGASNGANMFGNISNVYNGVKSLGSGVTNAVNEFGSNYLGFGSQSGAPFASGIQGATASGAPISDVLQGPGNAFDTAGSLGTTASFSSVLGGAGFGFAAGGFLSGLLGENKTGGAIGGAIGGALGASFLGGLSGVAVGAELGSVVPGIGTVIGAVAGSLLGGLFGGGKPNPAGTLSYSDLGSDGTITGGTFSGKHTSQSDIQPLSDNFSKYLQSQASNYGINYGSNIQTSTGYDVNGFKEPGTGSGNYYLESSQKDATGQPTKSLITYYDPNDAKSKDAAYQAQFNNIATLSGQDPTKLTPQTGKGSVVIPANQNPSTWQQWLANYRTQHTTQTTQAS